MADSGAIQIKQTEIDFGTGQYIYENAFTITDPTVTTASKILATKSFESPSDGRSSDEMMVEQLELGVKPSAGTFSLHVNSILGPVTGKFKINYVVTN